MDINEQADWYEQKSDPQVAQTRRATVKRQKPVVDREGVALFDPERFFLFHFDKAWSVLR